MKYSLDNICTFGKDKINISSLTLENYISTENMLPNKAGVTVASTLPTVTQTLRYDKGDRIYVPISRKYGLQIKMVVVQMMY